MTSILVVDDAVVDRRLVGGLLKEDADLDVDYAIHGVEALEKMAHATPELVLTDLIMPEMDGLELVSAIRSNYPSVPVILMTSQGTDEIAVEALQQGAASYVPKRALARSLLATVHRVLALSSREQVHSRLMGCMTRSDCTFSLENDCTLFAPLVTYMQQEITRLGLCDESERTRIGIALEEALVNALYHGNLEVGSELREQNGDAYYALVDRRRSQTPFQERRIHVKATLSRREAQLVVRDEGLGFDPSSLPDPTDPANLEKASGRGVLLMRTFMDDVLYNDRGNVVTLTKRRNRETHPGQNGES